MSDLRFFEELGVELERVARADAGGRMGSARRSVWLAAVVVALLLLAGVAAAAVLLIRQGQPLPGPPTGALGTDVRPVPGSVRLAGLDAPDPAGGPRWDIRLSRSVTGETCTAVGQIVNGQFGIVGLDGVFRRLGLGGVDACGVRGIAGPVLAGARVFVGRTEAQARTVVNGVAGKEARSVSVYGPGGVRRLRLGPDGTFLTVYAGYVEDVRPKIVVVDRDGRRYTVDLANSYTLQTADPQGGAPWNVIGGADLTVGAYADEECTQVQRASVPPEPGVSGQPVQPPLLATPASSQVCGRLGVDPVFVAMQRFVAGDEQSGEWYWFDNPPRTIVWGAAAPRVASLELKTAAGPSRAVPIDRSDGAFAVVLDRGQDPGSLELIAHLADGQTVGFRGSANLWSAAGTPVSAPPTPTRGSPNPFARGGRPPVARPIASTITEHLHAPDRAGGATWALRSWQESPPRGRSEPGTNTHGRLYCEQAGIVVNGRLAQPIPGGKPVALAFADAACQEALKVPLVFGQAYLADPDSYAPAVARVVISGFVPPGASHALLLGDGSPKPLALDRNGGFLAVLPGRLWDTPLRVSATLAGGKRVSRSHQPQGTAPPLATAPDPDGGPPWGFRAGPNNFDMFGQVIDDRLVSLDDGSASSEFEPGPTEFGGGTGKLPKPDPLLLFPQPLLNGRGPTISPAEVQRRTLPGRTLIAGLAAADVASVTIATPRDVRTVVPVGPEHAFIVAYDGYFYDSIITATAVLKDGRRETQIVPYADYPSPGTARAQDSLDQMLRNAQRNLTSLHQHRAGMLAGAFHQAQASLMQWIGLIRARQNYNREHPGTLPPN